MSSHREAPEISKDPVADSSDLYAFVSPDRHDSVTLIANYVPLQLPSGGPNFFEFGDDVRYEIHIDNDGDGHPDVTYRFEFRTEITNDEQFSLQHRADRVAGQQELEPAAVLQADPGDRRQGARARRQAALPAVQRRAAVHPQVQRPGPAGDVQAVDGGEGVRRAARGRLLRRPGRDLRPGYAAAVPAVARGRQEAVQDRGRAGQLGGPDERAQHRGAGAAEQGPPQVQPVRRGATGPR